MKIGVVGSGLMGGKLGTLFARAGHDVVFSYSRSKEKLEKLAREAGPRARAGTPADAVRAADAVLLGVHWLRFDDVLQQTGDLNGKVVITCSLPMNADDTDLAVAHSSSGAEELAKKIPHARIVAAFNTVPSEVFLSVYEARGKPGAPTLVYYGDDAGAKEVAAAIIRDIGFEPMDGGPLRVARYAEPFALLIAQLAYDMEQGPDLAYRFGRF